MFPYSGGKAISTPEVTVRMFPTRPKMANRELLCLALKVLACRPEEIPFTSTSSAG